MNLRDKRPQPIMCHLCNLPVMSNECPDCLTPIKHPAVLSENSPFGFDDPIVSNIDTIKPTPGPLSDLYDKWIGKRVLLKGHGKGLVIGTDSCPAHINIEGEYLWVRLDKPNNLGEVLLCHPVSEVKEM